MTRAPHLPRPPGKSHRAHQSTWALLLGVAGGRIGLWLSQRELRGLAARAPWTLPVSDAGHFAAWVLGLGPLVAGAILTMQLDLPARHPPPDWPARGQLNAAELREREQARARERERATRERERILRSSDRVSLVVSSEPLGTEVAVTWPGGERHVFTPVVVELPRGAKVELRATRAGHRKLFRSLVADASQRVELPMVALPGARASREPPPSAEIPAWQRLHGRASGVEVDHGCVLTDLDF